MICATVLCTADMYKCNGIHMVCPPDYQGEKIVKLHFFLNSQIFVKYLEYCKKNLRYHVSTTVYIGTPYM